MGQKAILFKTYGGRPGAFIIPPQCCLDRLKADRIGAKKYDEHGRSHIGI